MMLARQSRPEWGYEWLQLGILAALGALGGAALFAIPAQHDDLTFEGDVFANRVRAVHDAAIIASRPMMVHVTPTGYDFLERVGGRWTRMSEQALGMTRWRSGTRVVVLNGTGSARVVFGGDGSADRPMAVAIARDGNILHVDVRENGQVSVGT